MPQLSLHTPVDDVTLSEADGRIVAVDWGWGRDQDPTPLLRDARAALQAYFDGELEAFDLPLAPVGSAYQLAVWSAIAAIPFGEYQQLRRHRDDRRRFATVGRRGLRREPHPLDHPMPSRDRRPRRRRLFRRRGLDTKRWLLAFEARRDRSLLI